jgi:hypothetical protein
MARHRFRSQPSLQRSGAPAVPAAAALALIAVVGVGGGAFVGRMLLNLPAGAPAAETASRLERMATAAVAHAPPGVGAAAAPPPVVIADLPPPVLAAAAPARSPPRTLRKAKTPARPVAATHAAASPAAAQPTPQQRWEQQRIDYEVARAAYDANERQEGFRWAQRNNIRFQRYCRAAEQPAAFVEGCMNYLRPARSNTAETPAGRPADHPPSEG